MSASGLAGAVSAQGRIAHLASRTSVHRAFHWLHLHQPQILDWQIECTRIPAPTFNEGARAAWFVERFADLGLTNPQIDAAGNALAQLPAIDRGTTGPHLLVSAHLDTAFPPGTECEPRTEGSRILAPGVGDNAAGLAALLALAASLRFAGITPPIPLLFAANVGEEGEGDLRGMRHLLRGDPFPIAQALVLEGSGASTVVTRGLGSVRLRVTFSGPGGHSWADAGAPNPIFLLGEALASIAAIELPVDPRSTLNAGLISGGTSVNSIPMSATVLLDLRSTSPAYLQELDGEVRRRLQQAVDAHNRRQASSRPAELHIEVIGDRPSAELPADAPLLQTVRAVDRHLGIRTEPRIGSTDANLPLSRGIPAVALGGGGSGGGIHTLGEWFDPAGRELALRRLLLILLDSAGRFGAETQP